MVGWELTLNQNAFTQQRPHHRHWERVLAHSYGRESSAYEDRVHVPTQERRMFVGQSETCCV